MDQSENKHADCFPKDGQLPHNFWHNFLNFDAISILSKSKMRLEQEHGIKLIVKPNEEVFENYIGSKMIHLQNLKLILV